jgi:hypothetical protein
MGKWSEKWLEERAGIRLEAGEKGVYMVPVEGMKAVLQWPRGGGTFLQPEINVRTELHALGAYLYVSGSGWVPNGQTVKIYADDVPDRNVQLALGWANVNPDGTFAVIFDVRCTTNDPQDPDYGKQTWIRGAQGVAFATGGPTYGFTCESW